MKAVTRYVKIGDNEIDNGDLSEIISPVWRIGNTHAGEEEYSKSLSIFTPEQRLIFAVMLYLTEIDNGGHDQFYSNSTGIVWKDALAGIRELGIPEATDIIQESINRMGGNPSLDRDVREMQLNEYKPNFDDLDFRFYKLEKAVNFDRAMYNYILKHRKAFYFEGVI